MGMGELEDLRSLVTGLHRRVTELSKQLEAAEERALLAEAGHQLLVASDASQEGHHALIDAAIGVMLGRMGFHEGDVLGVHWGNGASGNIGPLRFPGLTLRPPRPSNAPRLYPQLELAAGAELNRIRRSVRDRRTFFRNEEETDDSFRARLRAQPAEPPTPGESLRTLVTRDLVEQQPGRVQFGDFQRALVRRVVHLYRAQGTADAGSDGRLRLLERAIAIAPAGSQLHRTLNYALTANYALTTSPISPDVLERELNRAIDEDTRPVGAQP